MNTPDDRPSDGAAAISDVEAEERRLLDSDTFCIIPWTHLHAHPDGRAFACCMSDMSTPPLGNLREQSINDVWNSPGYRAMRLRLLRGQKVGACRKCYEQESLGLASKRKSSNRQLGHHIGEALATRPDGSVATANLVYWDIRFSNLCNLSCRSCGALFSSSWFEDHVVLYGPPGHAKVMHVGRETENLWPQLEEHIPKLEKITFGGGEPMIMEEHYRILRELDARRMHHVRLFYHTNFTSLKYKDLDVLELWNRFEEVNVGASLDGMGARGALLRKGSNWEKIESNRRLTIEKCPRINFYVAPTLGLANSLHLPDFHRAWIEGGFIDAGQWQLSCLQEPVWLRLDVLPPVLKTQVTDKYLNHIEWLKEQGAPAEVTDAYQGAIAFMNRFDRSSELAKFVSWSNRLDALRNENMLSIFPELKPLFHQVEVSK